MNRTNKIIFLVIQHKLHQTCLYLLSLIQKIHQSYNILKFACKIDGTLGNNLTQELCVPHIAQIL